MGSSSLESTKTLSSDQRRAVVDLLYRIADDELIVGHRNSEWTGLAPILEEDIAFSSMAQDEMGHAYTFYQLLHELGEPDPDALAFARKPHEFRCCSLVSLPSKRDWALSIVRQFLYDAQESVRLTALMYSSYRPLADVARKLRGEEKYHLMHGRTWILRLGNSTDDAHQKLQEALNQAYPHALGLFETTDADETLAQAGICPHEDQLRREWESAVSPTLSDAGFDVPEAAEPVCGGRVGKHPPCLAELLEGLQLVFNIDPSAKW